MKKARNSKSDEMRAEYKRSDFKKLERGKFYQRVVAVFERRGPRPEGRKSISQFCYRQSNTQ